MQVLAPLNNDPSPDLQRIEIASSFQIPGLHIIGLPAPEVVEARERIRAALESCGFELPRRRVVLNLAPASIRKRGTGLDLAMALAVLSLSLPSEPREKIAAWGELSLNGTIKPAGQLTRTLYSAWQGGVERLFLCTEEIIPARKVLSLLLKAGIFHSLPPSLVPVLNLNEVWDQLQRPSQVDSSNPPDFGSEFPGAEYGDALLPLSPSLERSICVAALGAHHLLLLGPKGTGKSQAAEWLIALQPESSERMKIRHLLMLELAQARATTDLATPVRRVSPGVRAGALIGTYTSGEVRPGEFSLAHGGILIADEFPEWPRDSREALREPLERGTITFTRSKASVEFPARFSLAANGNLCPCGGWPPEFPIPLEHEREKIPRCRCSHSKRTQYLARLSGPILDRVDLVLLVTNSSTRDRKTASPFDLLRNRVLSARRLAKEAWDEIPGLLLPHQLEGFLLEHPEWVETLDRLQLTSLRSRHKVLRVALSLSAWDQTPEPKLGHFLEASCYRPERFGLCE